MISEILTLLRNNEKLSEIAILIRYNSLSMVFEDCLTENSIPYEHIGVSKFYQLKEIQDFLSFLKAVLNPLDDISFQKILTFPCMNLPMKISDEIIGYSDSKGVSIFES